MPDIVPQLTISFIILTWNSEKYLKSCFESIIDKCRREQMPFEVIVVDNGSLDGSCEVVKSYQKHLPDAFHLIALDFNKGTTYPRNLGLRQAKGDFICILDSDTELGEGSLREVLYRLSPEARVGMVAPRLLLPGGIVQNSVKQFPTMLDKLMKVPRIVFGIGTKNGDFYADFPFQEEREVDTAISACWFFHKALLDKVGHLDENIFYAPEDIDYSLRVWHAGHSLLYVPSFTVLHHTQQITHRKPFSKTSLSHFRGLVYYYAKHGGWFLRPTFKADSRHV